MSMTHLEAHNKAFEALLALIPAKYYYEQQQQQGGKKAKQSKQQAKRAQQKKLDPDTPSTALDVLQTKGKSSNGPSGGASMEDLRAKLTSRIDALRHDRKADVKNRASILEQRKGESKPSTKPSGKKASKEEGMAPGKETKDTPPNGDEGADGLMYTVEKTGSKRKGPSDTLGALKHAQAKRQRVQSLPEERQQAVEEREDWHRAIVQARGGKVDDNPALLANTLKRERKKKSASAKQWGERLQHVARQQSEKQQKRTENLAARRDGKAGKTGKAGKPNKGGKSKRPGFEGKIRAKTNSGGRKG